MVDVRRVVHPFVIDIMVHTVRRTVSNDDEVLAGHTIEPLDDARTIEVSAWPRRFNRGMRQHRGEPERDHGNRSYRYYANKSLARSSAATPPQPQVPHALHQQQVEQRSSRCEIVRKHPRLERQAEDKKTKYEQRNAHSPVTQKPGTSEQRDTKNGPEIVTPP